MKPTAIADLRMRLLKRALKAHTMAEAIGVMELTWHFAAEYFPDGRIPMNAAAHLCAYSLRDFDDPVGELLMPIEESGWATWEDDVFLVLADWQDNQPQHLVERIRKQSYRAVSQDADNGNTTDQLNTTEKSANTTGHQPETTAKPRQTNTKPPPVPGQGTENRGFSEVCPGTSNEKGEEGEGGVGVSEECAQGEGYRLQTEEAKPPKKKTKAPPITVDQVSIPEELDRPAVVSSLEEWLVYKRKRGQTYKDTTYVTKLLAQFLDDPPGVFEASVDYSIAQGYSGLFRPGNRPTPRDTNQTRRPLAANAFDQAEKELST